MNKNNPSRDPYQHQPKGMINVVFDLQEGEKLSDFLPSKKALAAGISSFLFIAWLSIWMGAILMGGCAETYSSTQTTTDEPPNLDAIVERMIAENQ